MTVHDTIPVSVEDMPYQQEVELVDTSYIFYFYYNDIDGNFMVDIYDYSGNLIVGGEPLQLNVPLWRDINDENLPIETIIPTDESGKATEITEDNLGVTVELCIDDLGDEADDS